MNDFNFAGRPSLDGPPPPGYRLTERRRRLPGRGANGAVDDATFARLRDAVLGWQIQRGSGFRPREVPARVTPRAVSRFVIPFGPLRPEVVCRVFEVVDEPNRVGFGHGALVGHPQSGWESFIVERDLDGSIVMSIRVIARPDTWWMRLAGPTAQIALELLLRRNLRSLDRISAG